MATKRPELSPAIQFLQKAWEHTNEVTGHSWMRLNTVMHKTLSLAICGGMVFELDDFATLKEKFNAGYWWGSCTEWIYTDAVASGNNTAWKAYEKWTGREPYILPGAHYTSSHGVLGNHHLDTLPRLMVGATFHWTDATKKIFDEKVTVTSFNDAKKSFTACAYDKPYGGKILHWYTITHELIKQQRAAIKAAKEAGLELIKEMQANADT